MWRHYVVTSLGRRDTWQISDVPTWFRPIPRGAIAIGSFYRSQSIECRRPIIAHLTAASTSHDRLDGACAERAGGAPWRATCRAAINRFNIWPLADRRQRAPLLGSRTTSDPAALRRRPGDNGGCRCEATSGGQTRRHSGCVIVIRITNWRTGR